MSSVKIHISESAVAARVQAAFQAGLAQLSEEILNDCNQYCKEDSTTLIASSLIYSKPAEGKLIWRTPYARRQYWDIRTAYTDANPGARWRWCDYARIRHSGKWAKQAQRLLEMNLKG